MGIINAAYTRHCIGSFYGDHQVARIAAAASTNATLIKAAPGSVNLIVLSNNASSARYVRFFDLATTPVPGTSVPLFTIVLEPSVAPCVIESEMGIPFTKGVGYDITAAVADSDTTATSLNDVHGFLVWS